MRPVVALPPVLFFYDISTVERHLHPVNRRGHVYASQSTGLQFAWFPIDGRSTHVITVSKIGALRPFVELSVLAHDFSTRLDEANQITACFL